MRKFIYFALGSFFLVISLAIFNINHQVTPAIASDYAHYMAQAHKNDRPVPTDIIAEAPKIEVVGEMVSYAEIDGEMVSGYISRPVGVEEALPGVILIHEWWGLNDNIKAMTDKMAAEGYVALAVDLYKGKSAENPDQAMELVQRAIASGPELENNLKQAYDYLKNQENTPKIASMGWCFGGLWSLNTALLLPTQLDATVIYYGGNITTDPEKLATLEMPILGIFGELDQNPSVELVQEFEQVLKSLNKDVEIHIYENADHAFANSSGNRYNPEAAQDAWKKTTEFLTTHLQ
ncbi:dienelactone hydrolase family protein [Cyanobacterium stanieri LEGE 03274]|uniref:Dienelactone hydrolase family protein n=1 Tax=Cyanobacterium stanieri LEGE 03274 TaxID=1828756 RepID=A0ABR9V0P1_9CHRO|nr:dienelactone hydrolase family protein [Cyanobacterium stanieri]MBE9221447.1 dienelactone hydrolase family protein [Cyanobacterium stanieri LEGE 03274]